jgi:hypothetical protein
VKPLPKTATTRRSITFTNCNWPRCGCKRDPDEAPYFHKRRREGRRLIEEGCVSWKDLAPAFDALGREQVEEPKSAESLPKTAIGSLHLEFKRCGRPNCRCSRGLLHGPYLYRRWREGGRQRKQYVPMNRLSEVSAAMERQRAERARPAEVRHLLKELRHA